VNIFFDFCKKISFLISTNPLFLNTPIDSTPIAAKILLWGEHSLMLGSAALALPLPVFGGAWQLHGSRNQQYQLLEFANFLPTLCQKMQFSLQTDVFQQALKHQGLYFAANIPRGYGVGSSGAVVAAVYRTFGGDMRVPLTTLRERLGAMESFFHGKSSGLDPLVSAVGEAIVIQPNGEIVVPQVQAWDDTRLQFFLLDTQTPRSAAPWIQLFRQKCTAPAYQQLLQNELVPTVQIAVEQTILGASQSTFAAFDLISRLQYQYFTEMIPEHCRSAWANGWAHDAVYRLKLCGAGGGGFLLGATFDWAKTCENELKDFTLIPFSVG
jgi:mevalonate kinase